MTREEEIKGWRRSKKVALIESSNRTCRWSGALAFGKDFGFLAPLGMTKAVL